MAPVDSLWRRSWSRRRAGRLCGCPPDVHPPFFSHMHPIIHPSSELKWSQMPRLSSFSSPDTDTVAADKRRSSQQDSLSVVLKSGAMLPPGFHLPDHSEVPESSWEDLGPSDIVSPPACPPELSTSSSNQALVQITWSPIPQLDRHLKSPSVWEI